MLFPVGPDRKNGGQWNVEGITFSLVRARMRFWLKCSFLACLGIWIILAIPPFDCEQNQQRVGWRWTMGYFCLWSVVSVLLDCVQSLYGTKILRILGLTCTLEPTNGSFWGEVNRGKKERNKEPLVKRSFDQPWKVLLLLMDKYNSDISKKSQMRLCVWKCVWLYESWAFTAFQFSFLEVFFFFFRDAHSQENAWFVNLTNAMVFVFVVFKFYGSF